jgi:unspecific monooxygenase
MKEIKSLKTPKWFQRIQYVVDPISYWETAFQSYPEVFWAQGIDFGSPVMMFYTPQAAQQINENRNRHLETTSFTSELRAIFGNNSLFTMEGARHQSMRKLLMPSFSGKQISFYGQLICDVAANVIYQLPTNKPFSAIEAAQNISMQVSLKILFGLYEGEQYQKIKHLMSSLLNLFASNIIGIPLFFRFLQRDLGPVSPWNKFLRLRQQFEQLLYTEITERCAHPKPERKDVLSLLMSANSEKGYSLLNNAEVLDQLLSLLFAGHEATASSIAWSWYWVYRNPKIKARLLEEVNSLGNAPDPISIFHLPYLTAVCNDNTPDNF